MTVIVGVAQQGHKTYLGADSQSTSDLRITPGAREKLWTTPCNEWAFGLAGSPRVGQLLRWHLKIPPVPEDRPLMGFLASDLADAIRGVLGDHGALQTRDGIDTVAGNSAVMFGHGGRLFVVYADLQISECTDGYGAIGSGANFALGALHATRKVTNPHKRIKAALKAADRYDAGVGRPFATTETAAIARTP